MIDPLTHADGCADPGRLERIGAHRPDGRPCETLRCQECGSSVTTGPGEEPLMPGTPEWLDAWHRDPQRIARCLTFAQFYDPACNPLHPLATWPAPPPDGQPRGGHWTARQRGGTA